LASKKSVPTFEIFFAQRGKIFQKKFKKKWKKIEKKFIFGDTFFMDFGNKFTVPAVQQKSSKIDEKSAKFGKFHKNRKNSPKTAETTKNHRKLSKNDAKQTSFWLEQKLRGCARDVQSWWKHSPEDAPRPRFEKEKDLIRKPKIHALCTSKSLCVALWRWFFVKLFCFLRHQFFFRGSPIPGKQSTPVSGYGRHRPYPLRGIVFPGVHFCRERKNFQKKFRKFWKKKLKIHENANGILKCKTQKKQCQTKKYRTRRTKKRAAEKKTRSERKTTGKKERTPQTTDGNTPKNHLNSAKPAGSSAGKQKFRRSEQNRPKTIKIEENPCKNACCRRVGKSLQKLHLLDVFDDILGGFWNHFLDDWFFDFFGFFFEKIWKFFEKKWKKRTQKTIPKTGGQNPIC
jgi:hypothetical protein